MQPDQGAKGNRKARKAKRGKGGTAQHVTGNRVRSGAGRGFCLCKEGRERPQAEAGWGRRGGEATVIASGGVLRVPPDHGTRTKSRKLVSQCGFDRF
ncbi:hypothetical protein GCM10007924_17360 [Sneathiella chinensis]|uniref:Uncharacterized protein n=1 Tax=Sneathiella chinensis TaxID=349750 RepID=A0ABQ5U4B8_9PROT|nr:hypothetical protein GCM10007924_17360 [Sneathiella chinensis]